MTDPRTLLLVLYLTFPHASSVIMQMFSCHTLAGGESWLYADLNIECYTPSHWFHIGAAIFFLVIYPLGVPLYFLVILRVNQVRQSTFSIYFNF